MYENIRVPPPPPPPGYMPLCELCSVFWVCSVWQWSFALNVMPRSHIHGSSRRFYYGLNLTDNPGNAIFRSPIRMHYIIRISTTTYDNGCNTESYGPIRIATNVNPWLIRRPVRECVTWALAQVSYQYSSVSILNNSVNRTKSLTSGGTFINFKNLCNRIPV